jgi:hypothetical protein
VGEAPTLTSDEDTFSANVAVGRVDGKDRLVCRFIKEGNFGFR